MPIPLRLLPMTATHRRAARPADGQGGFAVTLTTLGTLRCRLWPASAPERFAAGKLDGVVTHNVVTLPDADVRRGDELEESGTRYRVLAAVPPSVPSHHRKYLLEHHQEGR